MRTWRQPAHLVLALLYVAVLRWAGGPLSRVAVAGSGRVAFALFGLFGLFALLGLFGLSAAVRAARGPARAPRARLARQAVAVSLALLAAGPPVLLVLHAHGVAAGQDVLRGAFLVALLVALQLFPLAATARRERWTTALDTLIVLIGGTMVLWYPAFGPYVAWGGLAIGGAALSAVVLVRRILVRRESDRRAVTDAMTGLANRAGFRDASYRALARGARTGRHSAVLIIDVNGFKQVDDILGRRSGDLLLVEFAQVLRRSVPGPGRPARLGGDEFAVVLPDLDSPEQAYEVAGRIAAAVGPVIVDGKLVSMAVSIGVAVSAPGELTHDVLLHRADRAMRKAQQFAPQTLWAAWRESLEIETPHPHAAAA